MTTARVWYLDDDGLRHVGWAVFVPTPPKPKIWAGILAYYAFLWRWIQEPWR